MRVYLALGVVSASYQYDNYYQPQEVVRKSSSCPSQCPDSCKNIYELDCPYGVTKLLDECFCECAVCASQVGQKCDVMHPCDSLKNLYCDSESGTCENLPGRDCHVGLSIYTSGETFQPTCRVSFFFLIIE